jgi:hypothetical protein
VERGRASLLLVAGALVLAIVGVVIAIDRQRDVQPRSAQPALSSARAGEALDGAEDPDESRALAPPTIGHDAPTSPSEERAPSGRLRISIFDATTRHPLEGIDYVVYSERGGNRLHARGTTDEKGRAVVEKLPANTILIEARRHPPHAATFGGVWLKRGESRDVEIAMDTGGSVRARVVDAEGNPVAGVEILIHEEIAHPLLGGDGVLSSARVAATTDELGRFVVDHLTNRPRSVWIVDDEFRPEQQNGPTLYARSGVRVAFASNAIEKGTTSEWPDFVLPTATGWRGRVLDARGAPVAGALVSFAREYRSRGEPRTRERRRFPGLGTFRLRAGDALTALDGTFEIASAESVDAAIVWTREGIFERFPIRASESRDGLEFRLQDWSLVEFELVDELGAPVTRVSERLDDRRARPTSRLGHSMAGLVAFALELDDGNELRAEITADDDDIYRVQKLGGLDAVRRVRIDVPGFALFTDDASMPPRNLERRRCVLRAPPAIRLHVKIAEQPIPADDAFGDRVWFHACMLDMRTRAEMKLQPGYGCCGLGSIATVPLEMLERDVDLPVRAQRPFWVHVHVFVPNHADQLAYEAHLGPFDPGEARHVIEVPRVELARADAKKWKPPAPSVEPPTGALRGRIVDALTNQGVSRAWILLRVPEPESYSPHILSGERGDVSRAEVRIGTWQATVGASGYRTKAPFDVTVRANETNDLGTITLEPAPTIALELLEADGTPPPRDAWITLVDPTTMKELVQAKRAGSADGRVTFRADAPERFLLKIEEERGMPALRVEQRLLVARRNDEITKVALARWCDVEIRIGGEAALLSGAEVKLIVAFADSEIAPGCADAAVIGACGAGQPAEIAPTPGERRFRIQLAPGRYRLHARNPLFRLGETILEVRNTESLQVFGISSSR